MSVEVLVKGCDAVALLFCNYPRAFVRANWKEALDSKSHLMHARSWVARRWDPLLWPEPHRPGLGTTSCRTLWWCSNHLEFLRAQILYTGNNTFCCLWWGAPPALGLGPALGARRSSTSWNVVSEHIIQGALQGHKTALGVTLFIFNYCVCVSTYIEACSPREVRTAANSRILPALMQRADNSLHSNQIAYREKISFQGMRSGRLDCIILYWHFERIISLQLGLFLWKKWRL